MDASLSVPNLFLRKLIFYAVAYQDQIFSVEKNIHFSVHIKRKNEDKEKKYTKNILYCLSEILEAKKFVGQATENKKFRQTNLNLSTVGWLVDEKESNVSWSV